MGELPAFMTGVPEQSLLKQKTTSEVESEVITKAQEIANFAGSKTMYTVPEGKILMVYSVSLNIEGSTTNASSFVVELDTLEKILLRLVTATTGVATFRSSALSTSFPLPIKVEEGQSIIMRSTAAHLSAGAVFYGRLYTAGTEPKF